MIFKFLKQRLHSFVYAWAGIRNLWEKEQNTRIHLFFTAAVIAAGLIFRVSLIEWAVLFLTMAAVWAAEAVNSAVGSEEALVAVGKDVVLDLARLEVREKRRLRGL